MSSLIDAAKKALTAVEVYGGTLPYQTYRDVRIALRDALQSCNWWEEDEAWTTGCARRFVIEEGTPSDNSMTYCCYCGSVIKELE